MARSPEERAARRARRRRRRLVLYSFVTVTIAAAVTLGAWAYWTVFLASPAGGTVSSGAPIGNNTTNLPPPPTTILSGGTQYTILPNQHEDTPFQLNNTSTISGRFSASTGVNALLMTSAQYQSFQGGAPPTAVWSTGATRSGVIQASLHPGSYELVFLNPGTTQLALVMILGPVTATSH
jgi:hypothetical protein